MASTLIRVHVVKKEGSSGWFFHKVTTENTTINDVYEDICLKGLNPCYQKIDGQMTTVSVECFISRSSSDPEVETPLTFFVSDVCSGDQCFILDQMLTCVSIFLFNAKCTVKKKKKKKKAYRVNSEISHKLWDKVFFLAWWRLETGDWRW